MPSFAGDSSLKACTSSVSQQDPLLADISRSLTNDLAQLPKETMTTLLVRLFMSLPCRMMCATPQDPEYIAGPRPRASPSVKVIFELVTKTGFASMRLNPASSKRYIGMAMLQSRPLTVSS